jgi:pseudouridine synthase
VHGVARWISKYGIMSRTEAARAVEAGRVKIGGKVVLDPEKACHPERQKISIDGRPLRRARPVYLAMNKPAGYITTAVDPKGRPTVHDLLPPGTVNVQAVGRLDADTTGLLLFTNDTEFAARLMDSERGVEKVYIARIAGRPDRSALRRFEEGIELDGTPTRPARVNVLEPGEGWTRVEVTITEGRNRQVRRMWEALGHPVHELERIRIGPISLGDLRPGRTRPVREMERATLQAPLEGGSHP